MSNPYEDWRYQFAQWVSVWTEVIGTVPKWDHKKRTREEVYQLAIQSLEVYSS